MSNLFGSLLSYFLCRDIIVEFDYYFIVFVIERKMRLLDSCHCHLDLQFRESYYYCLLFFYNCKLLTYTILLLGLYFCKKLYAFEHLPHFCQHQTATRRFRVLNADVYDLFYLLNGYSIASFNLFLYRFQVFYHKSLMIYNVCVLDAHGGPVCCHDCLTCAYVKLDPIPSSGFVQLMSHSILVIIALKELLMVSKCYHKSELLYILL